MGDRVMKTKIRLGKSVDKLVWSSVYDSVYVDSNLLYKK